MSIAVLNQVYDEARRLAVAGSVVAGGDFRLKKLLPPLDQAGAKAPVFAKVAECARAVIDGAEDQSAERLLELTSLVTAVLYTQGETGAAGKLTPIETVDFGATSAPTSARLLKPLLEALSSTGSGRIEQVKEAHSRGAFRDLRLVKPALDGLDDPYAEIADFLATKVLPLYGKAILPELRAKYDPKGTRGHARRLKLMHATDPVGTRELVKQALDDGSKEVKVAAIACLPADAENLPFLIEQSTAKAADVRAAAYRALAACEDAAAVTALQKALSGKDAGLAAAAIERTAGQRLTSLLVAEIETTVAAMTKAKDKKAVSEQAERLVLLIGALPEGEHAGADKLTRDLFERRAELRKVKGATRSGSDVVEALVVRIANGPKALQAVLAKNHADLEGVSLTFALRAAQAALSPAEVYDLFAGYLSEKPAKGKAADKHDTIIHNLGAGNVWYSRFVDSDEDDVKPRDPRWLDLAVKIGHLGLAHASARPGHAAAKAFAKAKFDAAFKANKNANELHDAVATLVRLQHPDAADAFASVFERPAGKNPPYAAWYAPYIVELPKSAVPRFEAIFAKLKGYEADVWFDAVQQLRAKA